MLTKLQREGDEQKIKIFLEVFESFKLDSYRSGKDFTNIIGTLYANQM